MEEKDQIKELIKRYIDSGFDEESIEVAKRDLGQDVSVDVVETYMSMKLTKENRLELAHAFHMGMPMELGKKIASREKNLQSEVLSHIDEGIPFQVIERIVDSSKSAAEARIAFKDYPEEEKKDHIPVTIPEDEGKPKTDKKKESVHTVFDSKPDEPQVSEVIVEKQSIPIPSGETADFYGRLMKLMEEVVRMNKKALEAVISIKEDNQVRDPVPPYVPNAFQKKREVPHPDGYMRMVMMPDGSIHPVPIEYTPKSERKGFFAMMSRIFKKGTPQESLVKQLIDRKMKASQLRMILRAVRENLDPDVVRELINSDLPADEMDNIIDVAIEEKNIPENQEGAYFTSVEGNYV